MISDDEFRSLYFKKKKPANLATTKFFEADPKPHLDWMNEDLSKSGLTKEEMLGEVDAMMKMNGDATAGYKIPYYDLAGNLIEGMYRVRYKRPSFSKQSRYLQPSADVLSKAGLPPNLPYIHPIIHSTTGKELYCAEGEKKSVAMLKYLGLPTFGIGGCHMWRNTAERGGLHPWIIDLMHQRGADTLVIVPDGDLFRYDICSAYGSYAHSAREAGFSVRILNPPGKIDDLLLEWGMERSVRFSSLEEVDPDSLVQPASSLVEKFRLAFRLGGKGEKIVHQHSANVTLLLEGHRAFPKIWRNEDTNRVMIGDEAAVPESTEIDIANHLQYHLGFDKVKSRDVFPIIQMLAKRNSKSPFLNWIKGLEWDGEKRLEHWLTQCWDVEDSEYVREVSKKWLVSACARMDRPGTKLDWMFIVVGKQGTGKTSMPGILFNGNSITLYGEHNDKDLHMLLHSSLCVGFDELDSFSKRDSSNLKAMITRNEDAFRPPYASSVDIFPRRFTLYGCGNRTEFLQYDPSGYRRYAVVEANTLLNFKKLEGMREQLWAEAWSVYSYDRCKFWEVENANTMAEEHVVGDPKEEAIVNWVHHQLNSKQPLHIKDGKLMFTLGTICREALQIEPAKGNTYTNREVAAILQKHYGKMILTRGPLDIVGKYYSVNL